MPQKEVLPRVAVANDMHRFYQVFPISMYPLPLDSPLRAYGTTHVCIQGHKRLFSAMQSRCEEIPAVVPESYDDLELLTANGEPLGAGVMNFDGHVSTITQAELISASMLLQSGITDPHAYWNSYFDVKQRRMQGKKRSEISTSEIESIIEETPQLTKQFEVSAKLNGQLFAATKKLERYTDPFVLYYGKRLYKNPNIHCRTTVARACRAHGDILKHIIFLNKPLTYALYRGFNVRESRRQECIDAAFDVLTDAVRCFDVDKGFAFSSYLRACVTRAIKNTLNRKYELSGSHGPKDDPYTIVERAGKLCSVDQAIRDQERDHAIGELVGGLESLERRAVVHRFGLHGNEPINGKGLGRRLRMSGYGANLVVKRALSKLSFTDLVMFYEN